MRGYFTRERFGRPQFLAGFLLLAFLAQAVWLVHTQLLPANGADQLEAIRIREGWKQWHWQGIAGAPFTDAENNAANDNPHSDNPILLHQAVSDQGFDAEHAPLLSLVSSAPLLVWPQHWLDAGATGNWRWLAHLPFLACGVLLGASLWYVARRLCGNTGGLVALTFIVFHLP